MMETKGREWCVSPSRSQTLTAFAVAVLMAGCGGGGDVADDARRSSLSAVSATSTPVYDRDDLYRFFAIAFGAAPGVTYMGQLVEAADYGLSIKQIVNIFTTKPQFLETYPASLSNQEYAHKLVDNVVGSSASPAAKAEAVADIVAALSLPDWTRGDITYAIFNNLAKKPADDAKWAGTARKMAFQVAYAKHFTETMKVDTTHLPALRAVVSEVTESSSTEGDLTAPIQAWLGGVPPAVSSITASTLSYGQTATFTIDGAQLGQGFSYTVSSGCEQGKLDPALSAFRQTFTCKPGPALTVTARALQGGTEVLSQTFAVPKPQVTLATSLGTIVIDLEPGKARATVDNFLTYVDAKFYDGTIFHRVVRNFVAQGGGFTGVGSNTLTPKTGLRPPIALESNKGLSNLRGTVAMARTALPDSATSQFYFNTVNNTFLDYSSSTSPGYAVFGSVVSGLAVVDAMNGVTTRTVGSFADVPVNDIVLNSAIRTR